MGRDYKAYYYTHVGFQRDQMLERLQAEAKLRGVAFSTHIVDLLADRDSVVYGGGKSWGIWFPRGTSIPVQQQESSSAPDISANLSAMNQFLDDEDDIPTLTRIPAVR